SAPRRPSALCSTDRPRIPPSNCDKESPTPKLHGVHRGTRRAAEPTDQERTRSTPHLVILRRSLSVALRVSPWPPCNFGDVPHHSSQHAAIGSRATPAAGSGAAARERRDR